MQKKMDEFSEKLSGLTCKIMKDKKTLLIVVFAIVGMLMIVFSGDYSADKEYSETESVDNIASNYEEKLEKLISEIEGVGKVSVMITYESGEENVFASDKDESFRNGEQKFKNDYIIIDGENGETGLKIKSIYPEIKGVAVVCSGAHDSVIRERIISVVSALFDINTKNISVVSAEN